MDNAFRIRFLEEMGIDVWVPRNPTRAAEAASGSEAGITDEDRPGGTASYDVAASCEEKRKDGVLSGPEEAWRLLEEEVSGCRRCPLCESRTQTVFGTGDKNASWMLIGEAPGQSEDREGKPFVGRAGQLLTEMIRAIGLRREEIFIANILKCRPPNNRDPRPEEVEACSGFLQRQIELVNPKIILAAGRVAAQNLLHTDAPLGKLRGGAHYLGKIPVVVIYHPAYLLRSMSEKSKAWGDLQMAMKIFDKLET